MYFLFINIVILTTVFYFFCVILCNVNNVFFCLFYLQVEPVSICVSSIKLSITHPCHSFSATTCISIFSKIGFVNQSKPCALIYLHNIYRKLHKFATTNSNFFKNCVLQTCVFVKRTCRPLYPFSAEFATANSNFERINLFGHASS